MQAINALHICVNNTMKTLANLSDKVFLCSTMNSRSLLLHIMAASYVAEIFKSEELLSANRDDQGTMSYHVCKLKGDQRGSYSTAPKRCSSKTNAILDNNWQKKSAKMQMTQPLDQMVVFPD